METSFFFKNMLPAEEDRLKVYISGKLKKLSKMLTRMPADGVLLHVKGEKFEKHSAYKVELVLTKLSETFSSAEDSHLITKAVDFAMDRLIAQLKKSSDQKADRRIHRAITKRKISHSPAPVMQL